MEGIMKENNRKRKLTACSEETFTNEACTQVDFEDSECIIKCTNGNRMEIRLQNYKIRHDLMHAALKNSNMTALKKLVESGVRFCFNTDDGEDTCYSLAKNNNNSAFLNFLLENCSDTINEVNSKDETPLMQEIISNQSKNVELLINMGANVNYINKKGITALHSAIRMGNTPINIIKKLIEANANVNIQETEYENTPLHYLLKASNNFVNNGFEKVKLLIELGKADLNLPNSFGVTALMLAVKLLNLELIKYLLDNGAKVYDKNMMYKTIYLFTAEIIRFCENTQNVKIEDINNCFIPIFDILMEADGLGLLRYNMKGAAFLSDIFDAYEIAPILYNFIYYIAQYVFKILDSIDNPHTSEVHDVLLASILRTYPILLENEQREIKSLILVQPNKLLEDIFFKCWAISDGKNDVWECCRDGLYEVNVDFMSCFVNTLPLKQIKECLVQLKEKNYKFDPRSESLIFILLLRFLRSPLITPDGLMETIDWLLENNTQVYSEILFQDEGLKILQVLYEPPRCVWISAVVGNVDCLKKLLPYWNQHPLTIILFLRPWLEKKPKKQRQMIQAIGIILPFLTKFGGPILHGTDLHSLLKRYIDQWSAVSQDSINDTDLSLYFDIPKVLERML